MVVYCRKNQASLSAAEKLRFVNAVLALKASGKYDQYVLQHMNAMQNAHRGPAFLPWHREFLRRFEADLRAIDATVALPYWDWSVDRTPTASIWGADFMGGDGRVSDGQVTSGPFAHSTGAFTLLYDGPALRRRFGVGAASLPSAADVTNCLTETVYDVSPWNTLSTSGFRNRLEGWISGPQMHNRVHVWVGGSMSPASSPNDPVFFLHHCFVDKLWAEWLSAHPGSYTPVTGGPAGHNLNDAMAPWNTSSDIVRPSMLLDHHALGYAYDTEGICKPTLKFSDDGGTLKFRDDVATLKFSDDGGTLKFRDDVATLKFSDDGGTLKFRDDGGTLKFRDDFAPTSKFTDDGGPREPPKPAGGDGPPGRRPGGGGGVPFVLSTPHHSMAWARSFPEAFEAAVVDLQSQIAHLAADLEEAEEAERAGALSAEDRQLVEQMRVTLRGLVADLRRARAEGGRGR